MTIASSDSENKLRMGYWSYFQVDVSNQSFINNYVHKQCYYKITRKLSPIKKKKQEINKCLENSSDMFNDTPLNESVPNIDNRMLNLEEMVSVTSQLSNNWNGFEEGTRDIHLDIITSALPEATANGSSKTIVSLESTGIDLNVGFMQVKQSQSKTQDFLSKSLNITQFINEQINEENQYQIDFEHDKTTREFIDRSKDLSIQNVIIEEQTNINKSKINKNQCKSSIIKNNRKTQSQYINLKRQRSSSRKSSKRFLTSSSKNTKDFMLCYEDDTQLNKTFINGFEELFSWLRHLLMKEIIVPMTDIKVHYENILRRRKETYSPSILLASAIRARLELKFGQDIVHEKSEQLLTITNRMGHTCSYHTMCRLQYEAAEKVRLLSDTLKQDQRPSCAIINHHFAVKVADNFDMNKETLHGQNSLHMLNQIIVQTSENDEIPIISKDLINSIIDQISTSASSAPVTIATITSKDLLKYEPFIDYSFDTSLLAYSLSKYYSMFNEDGTLTKSKSIQFPLLSGFFATHLTPQNRPIHSIKFCTPIKQSPNDILTTEMCLRETKTTMVETHHQKLAVVVVDEKLYTNCMKVIRSNPTDFEYVFIYPGDFHLMKNTMIVIWQILECSGIEDILNIIYKGATLKSILNVHHFNKSFRSCKLLYTALQMLLVESYVAANTSLAIDTTSTSNSLFLSNELRVLFENIPNEYNTDSVKQIWFKKLVTIIEQEHTVSKISIWAENKAKQSLSFKFWYFILRHLFEPLIILYCSIRTSNFNLRNACVSKLGPLFFSTNHRHYARLCAQHLFDISTASSYLLERLSNSFSVVRSHRPFSAIALDQTIESSINKFGKGHGGITGKFSDETIDIWTNSYSFRATLTSILHEICAIETEENSVDSHIECTATRQAIDNHDLNLLLIKLKQEDIFSSNNPQFRKLLSGKIVHDDIINNITSSFVRGQEAMSMYIKDRLINKTVNVEEPLKAMYLLKLSDADSYTPEQQLHSKKKHLLHHHSKDLTKMFNSIDRLIRNTLIIAEQRNLSLSSIFSYEFAPAPLSLCDLHNYEIMNQQQKSSVIDYIKSQFPKSFSSLCPSIVGKQALIIDGGSILQIKPVGKKITLRQYANQLLKMIIIYNFHRYNRIDVVFDSHKSKIEKSFIPRHAGKKVLPVFDIKCDDILDSDYQQLINNNRATVAARVRECWCTNASIETLPEGKILVIAGPDDSSVTLKKSHDPTEDYLLVSNHTEADTRLFLHAQAISYENIRSITIQATDTDIIILAIAHILYLDVDNVYIKSFNTKAKFDAFINIREIALTIREKFCFDPCLLIVIHALSGCDTL
ncbi:unnamed protein product [Rotaria sp. Silwood1]|nr:unnamed protein product [Rotaria sp. Silwood1]